MSMRMLGGVIAVALLGAAALTCAPGSGSGSRERPVPVTAAPPRPVLPPAPRSLSPSLADLGTADGATLSDVDTCGGCHAEVFAQQQVSAHAYSSFNNPIYRVAVDRTRDEVDRRASRMCAGCHDIALLADGRMDAEIAPEDTRAHAGVTCRVCHGITEATRDGNGSYSLGRRPVVLPREGDAPSIAAHKASVAPLRTADMCGSCHRSFLDDATGNRGVFLTGQDDLTAWSSSAYNKSGLARIDDAIEKQDCIACHMPQEAAPRGDAATTNGRVASHRFLGGHTWLAGMLGESDQLRRQQELLRRSVSIDLAQVTDGRGRRTIPADGAAVEPGDLLVIDAVVRNRLVGHRFPGGVLDAQDTWIELDVRDSRGRVVARAGADHARTGADPSAHVLRSLMADGDARVRLEREVHTFRAGIVNHTIAPRDAVVARFRLAVPRDLTGGALPLEVTARVVHRSRNLVLQRAACAAATSERGRRFATKARELDDPVLDPCAPQPLTVLAEARASIGSGDRANADANARPRWRRQYELGMALLHSLQEHVDEAREPLMLALASVDQDAAAGPRERGMILVALGRLEGLEGRTEAAVGWLDRAETLMPKHPSISYARGSAFARVWRWREAADAFGLATGVAVDNAGGWGDLAMALGSLGREEAALAAAHRGLALSPRDADLLRVQALALKALGGEDAVAALDAYDRFRPPDRGPDLRIECTARDPLCALERDPVHVHDLVPAR